MASQRAEGALAYSGMPCREARGHDVPVQGVGKRVERLERKQRDGRVRVVDGRSEHALIDGERSGKEDAERPAPQGRMGLFQSAADALVAPGQPRIQFPTQARAVEARVAFQSE